ncbi:Eukaryotic elongation factor 2 kinase [Exaiptasia diaphana]|nr:Eukaryotic elongation factor 2 kinase [Exaiptasia diaphana]
MECDILAGERGPSFTDVSQISNWKVLHIRFVAGTSESSHSQTIDTRMTTTSSSPVKFQSTSKRHPEPSKVPASVPLSSLLNIGKLIVPRNDIVTVVVEEFNLQEKAWLPPLEVKVSLENEPFSSGSFRDAYRASVISGLPGKEKYVLKKFKKDQINGIEQLFDTIEAHTRKMVQMNALARNLALKMSLNVPKEFGDTFTYNKVYFGKLNGEEVTLERYLEGKFVKHINNTGDIYTSLGDELGMKCEAFVHYTYQSTDRQLMVVDIQGVGLDLCDPEIASHTLKDDKDNSIFFCTEYLMPISD